MDLEPYHMGDLRCFSAPLLFHLLCFENFPHCLRPQRILLPDLLRISHLHFSHEFGMRHLRKESLLKLNILEVKIPSNTCIIKLVNRGRLRAFIVLLVLVQELRGLNSMFSQTLSRFMTTLLLQRETVQELTL